MKFLITGSNGLIGSEAVKYFSKKGHKIIGIDNNMRRFFFGEMGDTTWNLNNIKKQFVGYEHSDIDIRNREAILRLYKETRPDVTIHCAAQPSHDLAAKIPFDDFDTNAVGTINLLESSRRHTPESPFLFMSTNKVYGDVPNELELTEKDFRWEYADPKYYDGIDETMRIDQCKHSLFGASKAAADIVTQEYGKYFNMPTVCYRGGCLTGPAHRGVELHGFLSYLVRTTVQGAPYTIYGYKGKQVRDQIHSEDVVRAFECYIKNPRPGEVYNLGWGRVNSVLVLEAIAKVEEVIGNKLEYTIDSTNRTGDHICYISNLNKIKSHYPDWYISYSLDQIIDEIASSL